MSKYIFILAFITWYLAGTMWTIRLYEYWRVLKTPISGLPRWGIAIMFLSWVSCIMTTVRLFAPYEEWANTVVSSLWLVVALVVLMTTLIKNPQKGNGNGKKS